jgi:transposase
MFLPNATLLFPLGVACTPDGITVVASAVAPQAACPLCGTSSSRVHSCYLRSFADLPCLRLPLRLNLYARRFFCDVPDCPRKIFTERLPEVAAPSARRTLRLTEAFQEIAHALGGEPGARLACPLGMPTSGDTLLRALAQRPEVGCATPRVLGVDDWARRKGQEYGTILVDLEGGEVTDLLPDRQAETLATWLKAHPGVEIITRDRATAYAEGARQGAPDAQQVADRWHVLGNLAEALEAVVAREERVLQCAAACAPPPAPDPPAATTEPPGTEEDPDPAQPPIPRAQRERQERRARKQRIFDEVRRLHREGFTVAAIVRQTGKDRRTVRKYLRSDAFPEPKQRQRRGGLVGFQEYLERRWQEGCHNAAQLWRELREHGYAGSRSTVKQWVSAWRAPRAPEPGGRSTRERTARVPAPRAVAWWLIGTKKPLTEEQAEYIERVKQASPRIALAQRLVREFFDLTRQREPEKLEGWVDRAMASGIEEMAGFCRGVRRDWEAVVAGLTLEWSNGPVEGQVNRLKVLKRAMFGRAGLPLLRARLRPLAAAA